MTPNQTTLQNQPSAELIEDIRKRLAQLPSGLAERVDDALRRESIEYVANFLWKAGHGFATSDLYEYRRTLFPPGAIVDPFTAGPPQFKDHGCGEAKPPAPSADLTPPISEPPSPPTTNNGEANTNDGTPIHPSNNPPVTASQLHEARQSLVQILSARAHQPADSSSSPPALLTDLRDVINRYVVLPSMAAEALALWIVHTYAFTLRQVTTYIGVVSPEKRCGKTTLLELLGSLAHEATAAANISPSALFRVIEATQPTLLIDEADTFLQGRDELCGILNAGYRKDNAYVIRVSETKSRKPVTPVSRPAGSSSEPRTLNSEPRTLNSDSLDLLRFSCWCPKVMAAIGRLPDTLADRCIVITMQRKMPGEKCERLRDLDAAPYRRRCAEFVEHHRDAIAAARPAIPSVLNDRAADIWEPLLAIADLAGGEWPQIARQAAQQLSAQDDELTPISYFLADLRTWIILNKWDRVLSRDIVASFNPVHNRPWEELRRGREINEWWLGRHMRQLGIRPRYLRVDNITGRGYLLDDIEAAFRRYVPKTELHSATSTSPP